MATAATGKPEGAAKSVPDLEADIAQLKADIEKLTRQLQETGQHASGAAKRAAAFGADQVRTQGEAALENLKTTANDMEEQIMASVREKPVTSLALAAGVGFLLALMTRR